MNFTTLNSWCKGSINLDEYCIFVSRDDITIWSMQFSRPMVCDYESLCTDQYFLDYEIHLCYCLPFKYQGNLLFHLEKYQQWIHCLYWKKLGIFVLNKCPFLMLKTMCFIISLYIFTKYWSKSYLTTVLSSSVIMFARAEPIGNPIDTLLICI